jgi:hypothetical protein
MDVEDKILRGTARLGNGTLGWGLWELLMDQTRNWVTLHKTC